MLLHRCQLALQPQVGRQLPAANMSQLSYSEHSEKRSACWPTSTSSGWGWWVGWPWIMRQLIATSHASVALCSTLACRSKPPPPIHSHSLAGVVFDTNQITLSSHRQSYRRHYSSWKSGWTWCQQINLHQLRVLLGNLFHMAQCCEPVRLLLIHMLATLRGCPIPGQVKLDMAFRKDIHWFQKYSASTNDIFTTIQDARHHVHISMDACITRWHFVQTKSYYIQRILTVLATRSVAHLRAVGLKCCGSTKQIDPTSRR